MKTVKSGTQDIERLKLLQEAAIMGQFSHQNITKLHGVVTVGDPVSVLLIERQMRLVYVEHAKFNHSIINALSMCNKNYSMLV